MGLCQGFQCLSLCSSSEVVCRFGCRWALEGLTPTENSNYFVSLSLCLSFCVFSVLSAQNMEKNSMENANPPLGLVELGLSSAEIVCCVGLVCLCIT